jgi:hypothetical protein
MSVFAVVIALVVSPSQAAIAQGPPYNTKWFTSRKGSNLTVSKDNTLTWGLESTDGTFQSSFRPATKTTVEVILTNLEKPVSLANIGESFNFTVNWLSTGTHKKSCPSSYYAKGKYCLEEEKEACVTHTTECLSGTGDFRIAFFDTMSNKAGQVTSDNFAPTLGIQDMRKLMEKAPFVNWRSYNLHFFPHVSKDAKKYEPTNRGMATPSSFCYRSNGGSAKEAWPFSNHKFADPFGGFAKKEGEWQDLTFSVTRSGKSAFELSVSSNGLSYKQTHTWKSDEEAWMPQLVDSVGIIYPNERGYAYVQIKDKSESVVV